MKNLLGIALLLLLIGAQPKPPTVAIRGVTIVDVHNGSLRPERTVLVAGDRITAVAQPTESAHLTMQT